VDIFHFVAESIGFPKLFNEQTKLDSLIGFLFNFKSHENAM
jgi:hypothetical protein